VTVLHMIVFKCVCGMCVYVHVCAHACVHVCLCIRICLCKGGEGENYPRASVANFVAV